MKLARTTLYVIFSNDPSRSDVAQRRQSLAQKSCTIEIRRPQARPAARWRMSLQTHRPECYWVLEAAASESQLCRRWKMRQRRASSARRLVSQIRYGVL